MFLFFVARDTPSMTGKVIKAKDWNPGQRDFNLTASTKLKHKGAKPCAL
jgi:hypothetical protein